MENLATTKLTVLKICHEIANCLSIIKFLQDDIPLSNATEANDFIKNIDLMSHTMDFFRNAYSMTIQPASTLNAIRNICNLKDIKLQIDPELLPNNSNATLMNGVFVLLYICTKISKSGDEIVVGGDQNPEHIIINNANSMQIPSDVVDALNNETSNCSIFNIMSIYAKELLRSVNYNVNISVLNGILIKVWQ
ncbi:hypothetical protein FACS1894113_1450 [Alphaproteobacteria bacterium]|nr:hypothetical protein FACS1894113_1450 [Alphaproteobacteria bacterium]